MRGLLNRIYMAAEWLAMLALGAIALMVFTQVSGRIFDWAIGLFGYPPAGFQVPSLAEIAGFLLVAASFLGLAASLRGGDQIRVTLALGRLPAGLQRLAEIAVLAFASLLAGFFFWYAVKLVLDSYRFGEVSYGIVRIPLALPQGFMALGIGVFALALIDDLVTAIRGGTTSYTETSGIHAEERL